MSTDLLPEEIADRIFQLLESLGSTPTAVADNLRQRGIKGWRGSACGCPIARLVERELAGAVNQPAVVDGATVEVDGVQVTVPPPVEDFIARFDRGWYSDLRDPHWGES